MNEMDQDIEIRNAFYRNEGRYALKFVDADGNPELTLTKQADKDLTDIDKILSRFKRTGMIDHVAKGVAQYGDFTTINEYQEALNLTIRANESFMALPAKVRAQFEHDPGKFFEFATDPKNLDELRKMGLANPAPVEPAPMRVEVVNSGGDIAAG